jgi:hypothetical protein
MKNSSKTIQFFSLCLVVASCSHNKIAENDDLKTLIKPARFVAQEEKADAYSLFWGGIYSCKPQESNNHSEECRYPTSEEIQNLKKDFLKDKEKRVTQIKADLKKIADFKSTITRLAHDFYSKNGENTFTQAYLQYANDIDMSYEVVSRKEGLQLVSENSIYMVALDKLDKFLKTMDARVDLQAEELSMIKKQKYLAFIKDSDFLVSIARAEHYVEDIFKPLYQETLLDINFDFNKYLEIDSCDEIESTSYATRKIFSKTPMNKDNTVNPVKDWKFFSKILHGQNGRPMIVTCEKVKGLKSIGSKYNAKNHQLVINYKLKKSLQMPMPGTDRDSFIDKNIQSPTSEEYIEVLKNSLK